MDHERIHDGWLLHIDFFENLDCSRKFLLLLLPLSLARRESMLQGHRDSRQGTNLTEISKRQLRRKRKATKGVPKFSCAKDDFMWKLQNNPAHTLLHLRMRGVDNSLFLRCKNFQVDAMHMLVKTLCTCSCGMVLMMHVRMTWLPIWWVSDCKGNEGREGIWMASCFLTTKIPSALLVAVVWLQHTRYPKFRHDTFGYGITTSPSREAE
jgi:hypothetical protein